MAAERRGADERALVVALVVLRHVARHPELVVPDVQDVALVERRVRDRLAVQERAVAAAEVAHAQREPVRVDLRVVLRDVGGGQDELQARRARPIRKGSGWSGVRCSEPSSPSAALEHPEAGRARRRPAPRAAGRAARRCPAG